MNDHKISLGWCLFSILACSLYLIFYLDISNKNLLINAFKFLIFLVPLIVISSKRKKPSKDILHFSILYLIMSISYLVGLILEGGIVSDIFFFNTILSIGFLYVGATQKMSIRDSMFLGLVIGLILGDIFDFFANIGNFTIWQEKSYVGGVGNPSSFGFLCNMAIAWLLFCDFPKQKINRFFNTFLIIILTTFSIMSFSMFAVVNLIIVFIAAIFFYPKAKVLKWTMFAAGFAFILVLTTDLSIDVVQSTLRFLSHKLMSFGNYLGMVDYADTSASVSVRVGIHEQAAILFNSQWLSILLGHPEFISYHKNDSQVLTYALSFGIPLMLIFMAFNLRFLYMAFYLKNTHYIVVFSSFLMIFFSNRILDYFPIAIFYFILISALNNEYRLKRFLR